MKASAAATVLRALSTARSASSAAYSSVGMKSSAPQKANSCSFRSQWETAASSSGEDGRSWYETVADLLDRVGHALRLFFREPQAPLAWILPKRAASASRPWYGAWVAPAQV